MHANVAKTTQGHWLSRHGLGVVMSGALMSIFLGMHSSRRPPNVQKYHCTWQILSGFPCVPQVKNKDV